MTHEFHPEALEEYREAAVHYSERDPGLALRFIEAVEETIQKILEAPTRWRVIDEEFAAVSPVSFHSEFSILRNRTSSSLWQLCTAAVNLDTGNNELKRFDFPQQLIIKAARVGKP